MKTKPLGGILRLLRKSLLLTMRIFILFFTILSFGFGSEKGFSQNEKVSFDTDTSLSVEEILEVIKKQTDYNFIYRSDLFANSPKIKVDKGKIRIGALLDKCAELTDIEFQFAGNKSILLKKRPKERERKEVRFTVSGTVSDTEGIPLPGANIVEKGTTNGVTADFDGNFTIEVTDENAVLEVSYIGYASKEIPVNGQARLQIVLEESAAGLDEVVVVGYGVQKKSDITGAVSNISEEKLQSRPTANFSDALQGRSSGVQIRQSGGDLDGKFQIAIRGVGSVTGSNDPLIVVDGVPLISASFSTINPKDIASIDILKDASATAIYGARAANGVVIITTKKGEVGKPQLTYSSDLSVEHISERYDVMSTEEQRLLFVEAFKNSNRSTAVYDDPTNPIWQVDTDWQDLGTRTGVRQIHNINYSGGTENTQYSASASYQNRTGTLLNTDLKTYSIRTNLSTRVNDWLKISTNITGSYQPENYANGDDWGSTGYRAFAYQHSYTRPYDEDGELTNVNTASAPYFGANQNPLVPLLLPTRERNTTRLLGNFQANIKLVDGLFLNTNFGGDLVRIEEYGYNPIYEIGRMINNQGSVTVSNNNDTNWVADATLDYTKEFGKQSVKFLIGVSAQQFLLRRTTASGTGTVDNSLNQLSNQTSFNSTGSNVQGGLASSFARLNYGYDNKYLLTATIRRDGSSRFGPDKRYGTFPSASVAWRISQENFLKNSTTLNDLKFRISYGLTGNQNIGNFEFITKAAPTPYVYGNTVVVGNSASNIGNPSLQWEANKQLDIGLDFALFKSRISGTIDYYDKKSEDLLIQNPIPLTAGVPNAPIVNIGSVQNQGVEFAISSRNLVGEFKWTTDFNIAYNKNEVLDIGTNSAGEPLEIPGQNIPLSNLPSNLTVAGRPVGAFYMYVYDGVWQLGEEAEAATWFNAVPGDPRYKDLNGNGVLDAGDRTFVGNPHPKLIGGLDNTFSYKNLSLSIFMNFATGNKLYNTARNLFSRGVPFVQNFKEASDFWTPDNPSEVPRPSQGGTTTTLATLVSTRFLEDASFLRVKNIALSYDLPSKIFADSFIKSTQFTFSGTNLLTFTKYTGLDPEASSRESLLSAGIDYTPYPNTRQYNLGVKISF
ncbi:SusC/RagA family TonB-linked outer membrane protein [Pseudozobellia thermophila]|uniref:TonB-linked outer membrane protein, SusC/RagA family n=1 Tax=Pseudozobellia thermophila TaxID=192903 RepID=A0A1M6KV13_9FLAO|nr:TonB-dependent receptor [Pseudozobellia thermophila]SHJ62815.1 TonB-linked outer membrane protein, SusC/RagA family [Pseudozobellia thermophila]